MSEQERVEIASETKITPTAVKGVDVYRFPVVQDSLGDVTFGEFENKFPFRPKRYFIVSGIPNGEIRGEHAHKECHQFLICAYGQCSVSVDDGATRLEVQLDKPNVGIYLAPMVWGRQWQYSSDAALLVFASELYDPGDYIREYDAFLKAVRRAV